MNRDLASPFGFLHLEDDGSCLTALHWGRAEGEPSLLQAEGLAQLAAFFDRRLTQFDLPLAWGEGLSARVRHAMAAIPMGETRRYGDLARALSAPPQAIGQACGANPLPIIIPCHRVLSAKGLGGYSAPGGIETKVALLRFEGAAGLLI